MADKLIQVVVDSSSIGDHKTDVIAREPILMRLHAGYFRITLSFGTQAFLWKILSEFTEKLSALPHKYRGLPYTTFILLWSLALFILLVFSVLYVLRCIFHFELVKTEFMNHVGANYLYAQWISWLLLLESAPSVIPRADFYHGLWWVFALPIVILDVKVYGQWFTSERRFLSIMANPTSQISVVGNLVGARAAARMGWRECAICMFSLGIAHYLVVFVTLYQRSSGRDKLPAMLRPVFFLFIATPSTASLSWSAISGSFDTCSKMLLFLSLFLFASLASRPALFRRSFTRFSIVWWAYSFPLTFLALASAEYARCMKSHLPSILMLILSSALSIFVFLALMLFSTINTNKLFHEKDLFFTSLIFSSAVGLCDWILEVETEYGGSAMSMMLVHSSGASAKYCKHLVNPMIGVAVSSLKSRRPCCKGHHYSFPAWKDRSEFGTRNFLYLAVPKRWMCQVYDSSLSDDEYRSSRNIAITLFRRYRNCIDRGGGDSLKEFINAAVNAYALGCTDDGLRKELIDMKESGTEIDALQSFGGSTSLKSKIGMQEVDECILWLSIIFITILCTPQPTIVRWSSTPPVSEQIFPQWKGFCALIANAYFIKGMAWLPVKTLQLEQMAVVGSAEESSIVASRMRLVFSTLEVVSPQWPKA
ncbi:unnamed protein product [Rhodiola kirilowii]